jgi:hypothetical protein
MLKKDASSTVKNNCRSRMTSRSQYRVTKNGSWQPYVPSIGVASGCRSGVRSQAERFNLEHLAKNYQDDKLLNCRGSQIAATAAACAFKGSSVIPTDSGSSGLFTQTTRRMLSLQSRASLDSGLIPIESTTGEYRRSCTGHVTMNSMKEILSQSRETSVTGSDCPRIRRRINAETLIPPDNLSLGLCPLEEFSTNQSIQRRGDLASKNSDCLGPGLIPLDNTPLLLEKRDTSYSNPNSDQALTGYKRVYGLQSLTVKPNYCSNSRIVCTVRRQKRCEPRKKKIKCSSVCVRRI